MKEHIKIIQNNVRDHCKKIYSVISYDLLYFTVKLKHLVEVYSINYLILIYFLL